MFARVFAVLAVASLAAPAGVAAPVLDVRYAGVVTNVYDPFGVVAGVAPGDPVSGAIRYAAPPPTPPDVFPGFLVEYQFPVGTPDRNGMSAVVGPYDVRATGRLFVEVYDPSYLNMSEIDFQFNDANPAGLNTAALPPGYRVSDLGVFVGFPSSDLTTSTFPDLPAGLYPLARYDGFGGFGAGGFLFADVFDAQGNYVDSAFVEFKLTAVEAVPEPASVAAFGGLLAAGGVIARRRRVNR